MTRRASKVSRAIVAVAITAAIGLSGSGIAAASGPETSHTNGPTGRSGHGSTVVVTASPTAAFMPLSTVRARPTSYKGARWS